MTAAYGPFALECATRQARRQGHSSAAARMTAQRLSMPMDCSVWLARSGCRAVVIDIGFAAGSGDRRGHALSPCGWTCHPPSRRIS